MQVLEGLRSNEKVALKLNLLIFYEYSFESFKNRLERLNTGDAISKIVPSREDGHNAMRFNQSALTCVLYIEGFQRSKIPTMKVHIASFCSGVNS